MQWAAPHGIQPPRRSQGVRRSSVPRPHCQTGMEGLPLLATCGVSWAEERCELRRVHGSARAVDRESGDGPLRYLRGSGCRTPLARPGTPRRRPGHRLRRDGVRGPEGPPGPEAHRRCAAGRGLHGDGVQCAVPTALPRPHGCGSGRPFPTSASYGAARCRSTRPTGAEPASPPGCSLRRPLAGTRRMRRRRRGGHIDGSASARYAHVTQGMRRRLILGLTDLGEAALNARRGRGTLRKPLAPVGRSQSRTAPVTVAAAPSSRHTTTKAMPQALERRVAATSRVNISGSSGA